MGTTPLLKLPIPELTDTADGPDGFSDLGVAVENYVYARTLPAGVTRYPSQHWGSGAVYPTLAQGLLVGDTFLHTGLNCLMQYTGAWRQVVTAEVATTAALTAISTNFSGFLYAGFRVYVVATGRWHRWNGSAWFKYDGFRELVNEVTNLGVSGVVNLGTNVSVSSGTLTMPVGADTAHVEVTVSIGASAAGSGNVSLTLNGVVITKSYGTNIGCTVSVSFSVPCSLPSGNVGWSLNLNPASGHNVQMLGGGFRAMI